MADTNTYTARWFELFLRPIRPEQSARETAFLRRQLPRDRFARVVDVCCGPGRHAHLLAEAGYAVTGIDRDGAAIAEARSRAHPAEAYRECDMRELPSLGLQADAVLCLWQSFGFFDATANRAVLASFAGMLPAGGRCILDLYHRDFFEMNQGTRISELGGHHITETKRVTDGRLHVSLAESDGTPIDAFEWQLYSPQECITLAEAAGLSCVLACTNYDEQQGPGEGLPRVQYVLEKFAA